MDMKAMLEKAHTDTLHHTALLLAAQDLESATQAARRSRELLRRATRNRLQAKERHADARTTWTEAEPEDGQLYGMRVELLRWALENAERDEHDALNDYRDALKRLEVLGATVGEADSHEVPSMVRHRARKAIALADSFGNKVAMDGTLHEGLERPRLPELEPEVEVQDLRVIDPLEPVEARTPPETRAVLVPVEDYSGVQRYAETGNPYSALGNDAEDPDDDGTTPAEDRMNEAERFAFWREVNHAMDQDAETAREVAQAEAMSENLAPVCPECRNGKHGNCDGTAWDDHEDAPASCSCLPCEAKARENGEGGK